MTEESGSRYASRQLDPYVAKMLAEEPPEVQRSIIGILSILKGIAKGSLRLELDHGGLEQASKKFESGLNRLTLGLVIAASLVAAALILNSTKQFLVFEFELLGAQRFSVTELLGLGGYVIATFLGLWLVFSIIRSGKL